MKCYLFLTFAIGGSYPHPKGCELATAYLSTLSFDNRTRLYSWKP